MKRARIRAVAAAVVLACGAVSCASDTTYYDISGSPSDSQSAKSNKIVGSVSEWKVDISSHLADEGDVIFSMTNYGSMSHEFLVVKTDFKPGKIPTSSQDRIDENGKGVDVVDEIAEWPINTGGVLKVNLKPGKYQLLCNLPGHYKAGMYAAFTVEPVDTPVILK